jgi:nitrous oxidase accessory protein NosD
MIKRHFACVASAAVLAATAVGAAAPMNMPTLHVVRSGQSIQKAVNAAKPGDTVLVTAGTYHESVKVTTSGLTLRGAGSATVIRPGTQKASDNCAQHGSGICLVGTKNHPVRNVTVTGLKVTGFSRAGLFATDTDRLTVRKVTAVRNGLWGIAEERSVRTRLRQNTARDNGDAGLFLANTITTEQGATDTAGTLVEGNRLEGNRIGVTVRRLRNLVVTRNTVSGNCAGVFVVGDENKPRAGALSVRDNIVTSNNKYCPKTARLPFLQGSGIVLTGTENTLVAGNTVTGNTGRSPLSGGIVLFKSFVGAASERNRVTGNALRGNSPADLVNQEETRRNNTFEANSCRTSRPAGLC